MLNSFLQFGADQSGIGALGVDGKTLVVQLITFIIVILVLRKWAIKPILKLLQQRRETIEKGVSLGEQMQKDQAEMEKQVAAALADARVEADGIIAAASENSREMIREAEDKARTKADSILKEAEERITTETALARKKLEGELVGLISDATETIVGEKVDAKKDAQLIDRALKGQKA